MSEVRNTIISVLKEIQERNSYPKKAITDESLVIKNLGFNSLDVAELVAVLEMELGVDPFAKGASIMNVHTVGELCEVYSQYSEQAIA